ncbi:MAG: hypothetical protein N2205_04695 [Candidatus Caldatribacterium sp.]|uniref:hypothetical protein n=1 Tax=Candidatus Caldatribacterium sp. TaxID=2282143 RepID=UPI0029983D92|nr:hypothetical protein [Candidatus Caldatribacterium sp.]MCX7730499.1 hypothetical protein [Candidatus Caldatribacterium sp.]MDW8080562.1 hypothetical protein [Candidatus Calescibacterium sp.]
MRMIVTMALLVIALPFVYVFIATHFATSPLVRHFIWFYLCAVLGVFLVYLAERR